MKSLKSNVFYFFPENEKPIKPKKKQNVYKILTKHFFTNNELTNQQKLFNIDHKNTYFYLYDNISDLIMVEVDDEDTKIDDPYSKNDDTLLLELEDRELIYLKNYLKTFKSSAKYILTIIEFYKHLLQSIQLLSNRHIFHNYINANSIAIDKYTNPLLTNFSLSINCSHDNMPEYIKHFIIAYEPTYLEWPIELHVLSYLLTNKLNSLSSYNIENIINEVIKNNTILNTFGPTLVSLYKAESIQYFKKYINQPYDYILTDMLQYSHTWDNYALSILFLRILIGIHRTIHNKKNKFIILFMKLLVGNIHLNPTKRLNIEETNKQFDVLLDSLEPNDYNEVIQNL